MSYLVFARKYRPQGFEEMVQQDHVTRTLSNAIVQGRVPHALLFTGPRGTGKTTVARVLAKAMNCEAGPTDHPCNVCRSCMEITAGHSADVFEIDGASNNSVDQVRELRDNLKYMPTHSRYKIYIIDEVHMLSPAAFNALLKTLEEPPPHVLFVFATTEPQKIPITILSRCQRHDLRRIDLSAIVQHMRWICDQENLDIDEQSLTLIASEGGGSMRDALSLLDHIMSCTSEKVTVSLVGELLGLVERRHLFELSAAVLDRNVQGVLKLIDDVWRSGIEMSRFFSDLIRHFHQLLLIKLGEPTRQSIDLPDHEAEQLKTQVADASDIELLQILDLLFQAEPTVKVSSHPKLAVEMVFLKYFQTPPALTIELLVEQLDHLRNEGVVHAPIIRPKNVVRQTIGTNLAIPAAVPVDDPRPKSAASTIAPADNLSKPDMDGHSLWKAVLSQVAEQRPSLAGFLAKSEFKSYGNDQLEIEIGGNGFILKNIQKHLGFLEQIAAGIQKRPLKIHLSANIQDAAEKEEQKKKTDELKRQTLSHPVVAEALDLFDGKVIDVKIK